MMTIFFFPESWMALQYMGVHAATTTLSTGRLESAILLLPGSINPFVLIVGSDVTVFNACNARSCVPAILEAMAGASAGGDRVCLDVGLAASWP